MSPEHFYFYIKKPRYKKPRYCVGFAVPAVGPTEISLKLQDHLCPLSIFIQYEHVRLLLLKIVWQHVHR